MRIVETEEERALRDSVRSFVRKEAPPEVVLDWDERRHNPTELFKKIAVNGWNAMAVPTEYGGSGAAAVELCIVAEELSRNSADLGLDYAMDCWGVVSLVGVGTEEQRSRYLPRVVDGTMRFSISITEPDAGSDAASLALAARREGDDWLLSGRKVFATGAHRPDNVIVMATRTSRVEGDRHRGITIFLVPNDSPGLEFRRMPTVGRRIAGSNELYLDNVRVSDSQRLGEVDEGWSVLTHRHLVIERMMCAASYIGSAVGAMEAITSYVTQREQFGKAIASFQSVRHRLADLATAVEAGRLLTYKAASAFDAGDPTARAQASMAKLFCSETSLDVANAGMQFFGGYGQIPEYHIERAWRNARVSTVGGGTSEIQRGIIAKAIGL